MALLTDSDLISASSLATIDSEVDAVSRTAKPPIPLDGTGSICELAWGECSRKILKAMQSYSSYPAQTGMPGTHVASVMNVGVPARTQSRVRLNQIVATESQYGAMKSAIELWVTYQALYLFYRDASARLGKDRYDEKADRYQQSAREMWDSLRCEGLPMVYAPMEAPGAKYGVKPGTWTTDNLSAVTGSATGAATVQVAITYCDSTRGYVSQASIGNAESAPSTVLPLTLAASKVLKVDITSLNPPTGTQGAVGMSQGAWTPLTATHWNIWAGNGNGVLYLQRELIPIATKSYTLTADPVYSGSTLGTGQYPDLNLVFLNVVMRG